ncbi:MAG TPA: DUF6600 domain-containing protein, partial [Beijerinckiaceae bacterium]
MRRLHLTLLCTTMLVGGLALSTQTPYSFAPQAVAQERVTIKAEFRTALEPYGRFERHERFGEVWRPAKVAKDWRPYTVGRWVYTDDWGWYWNAAEQEATWGWVAFHYGRWINDDRMGWVWVAGDEWAPAWVNWRRGEREKTRYVGWSPLPPDEVITEVRDDPDAWVFVRAQDVVAPSISRVVVRTDVRRELVRDTVVVNRTVIVRDRGPEVVVNPGIEAAFVAAAVGRPIRTYEVRPRVFAGTTTVRNAIEIRGDDLRDRRRFEQNRVVVRETRSEIRPARDIAPPRELGVNEQGRLGDNPPRAARRDGDDRRDDRRMGEDRRDDRRLGDQRDGERDRQMGDRDPRDATQPGQRGPAAAGREDAEQRRQQQGRDATQKPGAKPADNA